MNCGCDVYQMSDCTIVELHGLGCANIKAGDWNVFVSVMYNGLKEYMQSFEPTDYGYKIVCRKMHGIKSRMYHLGYPFVMC